MPSRTSTRLPCQPWPPWPFAHPDRHEAGVALDRRQVEETGAVAEALVGLLQGDDVGADLADHRGHPRRIEAPVDADALVDVVGGENRPLCPLSPHRRSRPNEGGT